MITNAIRLLIICVFAFIPLLLGEFARNKAALNTSDFILQGRKLKIFPMYATVFATWMSIFAFIGGIASRLGCALCSAVHRPGPQDLALWEGA